jgi:hypothetical protein
VAARLRVHFEALVGPFEKRRDQLREVRFVVDVQDADGVVFAATDPTRPGG